MTRKLTSAGSWGGLIFRDREFQMKPAIALAPERDEVAVSLMMERELFGINGWEGGLRGLAN